MTATLVAPRSGLPGVLRARRSTARQVATSAYAVYQFKSKKSGMYFLTTSTGDEKSLRSKANRKKWSYSGIVFYMAHR